MDDALIPEEDIYRELSAKAEELLPDIPPDDGRDDERINLSLGLHVACLLTRHGNALKDACMKDSGKLCSAAITGASTALMTSKLDEGIIQALGIDTIARVAAFSALVQHTIVSGSDSLILSVAKYGYKRFMAETTSGQREQIHDVELFGRTKPERYMSPPYILGIIRRLRTRGDRLAAEVQRFAEECR